MLSRLPFWALYILSDFIYFMLYRVTGYRKKIIDENLMNAFPEKTEIERLKIRREFVRYLSEIIVETIKLFTISEKEIKKRVAVTNVEYIHNCFENGKSVIGILGHYGNWELGGLRFSQLFSQKRIIVYKRLSNKHFDSLMLKMRSRFGASLIEMKQVTRKLLELKNEVTITVLAGDQSPAKSEIVYFAEFLNQKTPVFLGAEKLAKRTNSVVVFCDIRRVRRGYYTCNFVPLLDEPKSAINYDITNSHLKYLENIIRQEPSYWLWSHRRWKYKPQDVQ
jgi:KDO2-lipid IV(A) lauroyltransferase